MNNKKSISYNDLIDGVMELSTADFIAFTNGLAEKLNVDLSALNTPAPVATASAPMNTDVQEEADEDAVFKIVISSFTCEKPAAMKALRTLLGTSLIETKGIMDKLPYDMVDKPYNQKEAKELSDSLNSQGFDTKVVKV